MIRIEITFFELPSLNAIVQLCESNGIAYGGYAAQGLVVNQVNERVRQVWTHFAAPLPRVFEASGEPLNLRQGHLYITREELALFGPLVQDYLVNWSNPFLMSLIAKVCGKCVAIAWCAERIGVEQRDVLAFGDGFNNVDILRWAGIGVAMGNGTEALKEVADYVAGDIEADGISFALKDLGLSAP